MTKRAISMPAVTPSAHGSRARAAAAGAVLLMLACGQAMAAAIIGVDMDGPAQYIPGTRVENGWSLTVSNTGDAAATPEITTSFPAGATVSWTCVAAGAGSSCANASGSGNLARTADVVGATNGTLTYVFDADLSSSLSADPLTVTGSADPDGTAVTDDADSALSPLTFTFTGPATYTPGRASSPDWVLVVSNSSGSTISNFDADVSFSGNPSIAWTCTAAGTGSDCNGIGAVTGTGDLDRSQDDVGPNGGTITYTLEATYASSTTTAQVSVTGSAHDGNQAAPTMVVLSDIDRRVNVTIDKTDNGTGTYTPGTNSSWRVAVGNTGPSDLSGVLVTDTPPAGMTVTGWTCTTTGGATCAGGTGSLTDQSISLPADSEAVFIVTGSHPSSATASPITNTAAYTLPSGVTNEASGGSSDTASKSRLAVTDLSVTAPADGDYTPGTSGNTIQFTVTNAGPSDIAAGTGGAVPADVGFVLPKVDLDPGPGVDMQPAVSVAWACSDAARCNNATPPAAEVDDFSIPLRLTRDQSVTITLTVDYPSSLAASPLTFTADVETDESDPDASDDTDAVQFTRAPVADLEISKTASAAVVNPGTAFSYDLTVTNHGPSDTNALVTDTLDPALERAPECNAIGAPGAETNRPCWEYCSVAGKTPDACQIDGTPPIPVETVRGSGDLAALAIPVPAGQSIVVRIHAAVGDAAGGTVSNTASVALPSGVAQDASDAPDSSSVDVDIEISTDISVEKDDGTGPAVPGESHSYTVTVRNDGFVAAEGVLLTDVLPLYQGDGQAGFIPGSISWQCSASGGACCNTNSAQCGTLAPTQPVTADALQDHGVDLPSDSQVVFTFTGMLDPRATGTLSNTASVTLPAGVEDTDAANNTDTDTTTLEGQTGLAIDKRLILPLVENGDGTFRLEYAIEVSNAGPSRADNVQVLDSISDSFDEAGASWSCVASIDPGQTRCDDSAGTGSIDTTVDLDVGGAVTFTLFVDTNPGVTGLVSNEASATLLTTTVSDSVTSGLRGRAELSISKTDGLTTATPGEEITYTITIQNDGPDDAFGVQVTDVFERELEDVAWACSATTPIPGDLTATSGNIGAPFSAGNALAVTADGRHAYQVGTADNAIIAYDRNNVPGFGFGTIAVLETEIDGLNDSTDAGADVAGMQAPVDVAITAGGSRVYVLAAGGIAVFDRDTNPASPNYGRLAFAGALESDPPGSPREMALTADFLFVAASGGIAVHALDPQNGLPGEATVFTDGNSLVPLQLAVMPQHGLLFAAAASAPYLRAYAIGEDGSLTVRGAGIALAQYAGATALVAAPEGQHLYLSSQSTGQLSMATLAGEPLALAHGTSYDGSAFDALAGAPATDPLTVPHAIAVAPDGEHLLVASNAGPTLLQLRRDPLQGGLTAEAVLQRSVSGMQPAGVADALAVTSDGRHVLVASGSSAGDPLQVYTRRAPDPLFALIEVDRQGDPVEPSGTLPGLLAPADVAVSPDGKHVYAVSPPDDTLTVFRRTPAAGLSDDTAGGHLSFVASYQQGAGMPGLLGAHRVRISPDGMRVYVASEEGNSIASFVRDTDDGTLAPLQVLDDVAVTMLAGATGIAINSSHTRVYVAAPFDDAIAVFKVVPTGLAFLQELRGGQNGVTGLDGVTDLALSGDGQQLLAVSALSNTVAVFNVATTASGDAFGQLAFVQARLAGAQLPTAISLPRDPADPHVYIAAANSDELVVMRRILDPSSPEFGRVVPLFEYSNNQGGISGLDEPWDLQVSPNGRRLYVAARNTDSVLIFDRDLNQGSANYGGLVLAEVRTDGVDGVDGLERTYALAVSGDSRHVYVAGFDDAAVASFAIGSGSSCSAGGSGTVDDLVTLGKGGTLEYRISARIRPDATGQVCNTATVARPENFEDELDTSDNTATDCTSLQPEGDLSVSKTNDQVSVVAGQPVTYEVVVRNPGPSHLVHSAGTPVTLTDLLAEDDGFVPSSATWTCTASGSGALDFVAATLDGDPGAELLAGVTGLALLPDQDGEGAGLGAYLAAAGVLDNAVTLFRRDPLDGRLLAEASLAHGGANLLAGARALAASADGRFLYVASRVSDSVSVLRVDPVGTPALAQLTPVQTLQGVAGLDQAVHLLLHGQQLYVAGANDSAIAAFARDPATGLLTWLESEVNGSDDLSDAGGTVAGLANVQWLVASPDGAHLYALSGSGSSIARFERDGTTGLLSWAGVLASPLPGGASLAGAAGAVFSSDGAYLYVAASDADAVLVLQRNPATGALTLASQVTHGVDGSLGLLGARGVLLSGDGNHLYVTAQAGDSVAWYLRDTADGSLRYLGQRSTESAGVSGLAGATGLVLDDILGQVYVAGTLADAVVQLERQSDSFCPASGSGPLVDVPFSIAAGGSVTFRITVDVSSTLGGALENTVTVDAGSADTNPDNNAATDIDVHSAVADLTISKDDGLAEYDGLAGASAIAGDATHLFVAGTADNAIGVFARVVDPAAPGGQVLRFASVVRGGEDGAQGLAGVADLLLSSDGAHVYVASPVDNSVATYERGSGGALSFAGIAQNGVLGVTGLSGARALAQSPDGRHVYALGTFSSAIVVFARDADPASPDHGQLSFQQMLQNGVGGTLGLGEPVALAVSPDGAHVYALGAEADTLAVFLRNPNPGSGGFGDLSYKTHYTDGGAISGMAGVRSVQVHPGGSHVYVLGGELGSLAYFTRNGDGTLAFQADLRDGEDGVEGLAGASRLRGSADGASLYVAAAADASLLRFDLAAGVPAFAGRIAAGDAAPVTGGNVHGLAGASDLYLDGGGAHVFSVAAEDAALAAFGRAGDGALSFHSALFDGLGGVAPGDAVRYVIRVDNLGPSDVANARVVDSFPEAFSAVSWRCFGSDGAQCVAGEQSGNIDVEVNLPVGSHVVFEADGIVGESATGRLVNTATVTAMPDGDVAAVDPDESSNSATDGDTVLSPAYNLAVSVDDGADTAVPGAPVSYQVLVANLGPSYAEGVTLSDTLPPALREVAWSCAATPVAGVLGFASEAVQPLAGYRALRITALGQHAYAIGPDAGGVASVVLYQRDPLSGALSEKASYEDGDDASAITGASDLVLSGDQRFLWVAGTDADAIALFARDVDTGALTFVDAYQDGDIGIDGLGGVAALALSPDGMVLYAASRLDAAITAFAVDPATGALAPLGVVSQAQPGVEGLNGVDALAFSADGSHLFAIAGENQALSAWQRAANGTLSLAAVVQDFELGVDALLDPTALLVAGPRVLVADAGSDSLSQFAFDPEQGFGLEWRLADGEGINGLQAPRGLAFDPEQARLYVAAEDSVHLLSLLGSAPEPLASYDSAGTPQLAGISGLLLAPDNDLLYSVAAPSGVIAVFSRERGSRCEASGLRSLAGQQVDIAPGGTVAFQVTGLVFANATGTLEYGVSAAPRGVGEELDPSDNSDLDQDTLVPAPDLAALKSDGRTEVVAGTALTWRIDLANAGVSDALGALVADPAPLFPGVNAGLLPGSGAWTCAANMPLAAGTSTGNPLLAGVTALAVAPDGSRLYAVNPATDTLLSFPRSANGTLGAPATVVDGQSLAGQTVAGLAGASSVAVTPDGSQLLVTAADDDSLAVFSIGAGPSLAPAQVLTSGQGGVAGLLGAAQVVVSADGRRVFVASPDSDAIAVFSRDPASGALAFVERVRDGNGTVLPDSNVLQGVHALRLSVDGSHLYALAADSQAVTSFAVHPQTGRLTYLGRVRSDDPAGASLAGARGLAGSGESTYVLGAGAITLLHPGSDGALGVTTVYDAIPGLDEPRAIALDAPGSRLYLADAAGAVHVFARDWTDGSLSLRQRYVDALLPLASASLLSTAGADLYLAQPAPGRIERLDEQALSRCFADAGNDDAPEVSVDLGVGGWAAVEFSATVDPSARGTLANTATVLPGDGADPSPADNAASDSTTIRVVSDLSLTKSGPATAVAGEVVQYQLVVANAGPSSALGMRVLDALPVALEDASWTCTASPGSTCEASGSGSADVTADLLPGGSLEVVLAAKVAPGFRGVLPNTSSLVMEAGASDPTMLDQTAMVQTGVTGEVALSLTKDNGADSVVAGLPTTYTITVANAGPSDALAVDVADLLPEPLEGASWTCSATGSGSTCPSGGTGDLQATAAVGAGGSIAFSLEATVNAAAEGVLENTASVSILDATLERTPGDEQDTDSDGIALETGLSVLLSTPVDPFDPASAAALPVAATVANAGPSLARSALLTLTFSAPVTASVPVGCTLQGQSVVACSIASIEPGSATTLDFGLRNLPPAPGTFSVLATVLARDTDPSAGNDQDSHDVTLQTGGDIQVAIDNDTEQLIPGRAATYVVDVANIGSATVAGVVVQVVPEPELLGASWTCTGSGGATCAGSGTGAIDDVLALASGQSVRYRLSVVVDPALDPDVPMLVAQAASATAPAGSDMNTANNTAVDEDVVFYILFADGFEDPLLPAKAGSDRLSARECDRLGVPPEQCPANQEAGQQ